jgi:hypothetical protein
LSSTYEAYKIILTDVVPASDDVALQCRTSTDGGSTYDNGASDYRWVTVGWSASGSTLQDEDTADSLIRLSPTSSTAWGWGSATNERGNGEFILYNPSGTGYTIIGGSAHYMNASANAVTSHDMGIRQSAADVDAIQFFFESGNVESGEFTLYGMTSS